MKKGSEHRSGQRGHNVRLLAILTSALLLVLGGIGAYTLWNDTDSSPGSDIASGSVDIVSTGEPSYRRGEAEFDPTVQALEAGQTVTITIPVTVRVTGSTLNPVLDASGWVVPEELIGQVTVSAGATPVTVSENDQSATVTLTITAAEDARLTGENIDLSKIILTLSSGTTWRDTVTLELTDIMTNTPPTVTPLFSADDRGDSTLDFTPFAGQVGDTTAGQLTESAYLRSFFSAEDAEDGDLTDQVEVSSEPTFDPVRPGDYAITGSVTDSGGLSDSANGHRAITVWNLVQVDAAYYNAIALDSRGRAWSWGQNSYGENHGAADGIQTIPAQIINLPPGRTAISVAAAHEASFVVMDDGSVYSFGSDASGQLGNGASGNSPTPTRISFPGDPTIIKVDAFHNSVAALASDGSVYTWGNAAYAALGLGNTTDQQSPTKIDIANATDISMGLYGGIARISNGEVMVWGSNWAGQNGDGTTSTATGAITLPTVVPGLTGVTKVAAGYDFMLAATSDGSVYGWGSNNNYRSNPNVGASTANVTVPTKILNLPSGKTVTQINAGYDYGQVVYSDGTLWAWGYNSYDSLFIGNDTSQNTPVQSPIASDVAMITGNYDISLYLNEAGTMIYGRGYGGRWGLGNNSTSNYISSAGTVAQITRTNLYRDGTGVDANGDPTPLSTSSPSAIVARMLGIPATPTRPGYTSAPEQETETSESPEETASPTPSEPENTTSTNSAPTTSSTPRTETSAGSTTSSSPSAEPSELAHTEEPESEEPTE